VPCLERALDMLALLVQLRVLLGVCDTAKAESYVRAFRQAGAGAWQGAPLRLSFRAVVSCCAMKLEGPYTSNLSLAMSETVALSDAAQRGWPSLQSALHALSAQRPHSQRRSQRAMRGMRPRGGAWTVGVAQVEGQVARAGKLVQKALRAQRDEKQRKRKR
ncbi:unnamed protein product, partial [Durusdinium trenchii]